MSDERIRSLERAWIAGDAAALVELIELRVRRSTPSAPEPSGDWTEVFSRVGLDYDDVREVYARHEEPGDLAEWSGVMLASLKDGRIVAASGWCDTTGWGCQDGSVCSAHESLTEAIAMGLTDVDRRNLLSAFSVDP